MYTEAALAIGLILHNNMGHGDINGCILYIIITNQNSKKAELKTMILDEGWLLHLPYQP